LADGNAVAWPEAEPQPLRPILLTLGLISLLLLTWIAIQVA
jgi:hypothetical protein